MRRTALLLALLLLARAAVGPVHAADAVEIRSGSLLGFAVVADLGRSNERVAIGLFAEERALVGLDWRQDGWKVTALGGSLAYAYAGGGEGTARAVSFAAGHETSLLGGRLALELRQTIMWERETRLDVTQARLGWSLKF